MGRAKGVTRQQLTMPRKDVEFLDTLGLDCKSNGGHLISRSGIIRSLVTAGKKLGLDAEDLRTGAKMVQAVKRKAR